MKAGVYRGENVTEFTSPVWPSSVRRCRPSLAFHRRMVLSQEPEAMVWQSETINLALLDPLKSASKVPSKVPHEFSAQHDKRLSDRHHP